MQVLETKLPDVWLVQPELHEDFRGDYVMLYNEKLYKRFGVKFVEHDISTSIKGVLRGIHYSPNCWKLNECLVGKIYYVVVNCDKESSDFKKWQAFILSDENRLQLVKHPRYGSGFYVLSDFALFHYMQSQYYDANDPDQQTFKWDKMGIWWPDKHPIVSERDERGEYVRS